MVPAICGYLDVPGGIFVPTEPLEGMGGPGLMALQGSR